MRTCTWHRQGRKSSKEFKSDHIVIFGIGGRVRNCLPRFRKFLVRGNGISDEHLWTPWHTLGLQWCVTVAHMTNSTVQEINRLHAKLSAIYHLGALTPAEQVEVDGTWARIERLTTTAVAMQVKENNARQALLAARAKEEME